MGKKFVDCFMLMGTALSLQRGDQSVTEMGRPILHDISTTIVNVSITLQDIRFVNPRTMEVEFTFLLHQRWTDPRLGPNGQTKKMAVNGQIWRPWITATEGQIYVDENDLTQYWRGMAPEGNILYSEKVVLRTFCTTDLRKFPFDTQKCAIKLGTYRFPVEEVNSVWSKLPVEILTGNILNEFELIDVVTHSELEIRPSGNFTVLVVQLTIKRLFEHYLFCIYLPCIFLITVSYLTFWIRAEFMNVRYFISIINLSILFYVYYNSVCFIAPVPYLKALDLSVLTSLIFVFITLVENLIIDINFRKDQYEEYGSRYFHKKPNYNAKYKLLDRIACILYPLIVICVIVFYFLSFIL